MTVDIIDILNRAMRDGKIDRAVAKAIVETFPTKNGRKYGIGNDKRVVFTQENKTYDGSWGRC